MLIAGKVRWSPSLYHLAKADRDVHYSLAKQKKVPNGRRMTAHDHACYVCAKGEAIKPAKKPYCRR